MNNTDKNVLIATLAFGFILCLAILTFANAEVYLLVNKDTQEVKDLSPENDAVVEPGYEKIILPGGIADYELQNQASYYKYKDKKLVLNVKKISDEEIAKQALIEKQIEDKLINDEVRTLAIASLKAKGVDIKTEK